MPKLFVQSAAATPGPTTAEVQALIDSAATTDYTIVTFSFPAAVSVKAGAARWYAPRNYSIVIARASVGTAPTGATLLSDVNIDGSTIFTDQSKRPTIAISEFTDLSDAPDVTSLLSGHYLTADIDQVGSTIPGSDWTLQVILKGA